jgi:hypothetical protein
LYCRRTRVDLLDIVRHPLRFAEQLLGLSNLLLERCKHMVSGRLARLRASLISEVAWFCSCRIWLLICSSVRAAVRMFCE